MPDPVPLAKVADIPIGKVSSIVHAGVRIAIFHTGIGFFAIEDRCTHAEVRLSDGWVEGNCVSCPWHGAQFDLATGEALSGPAVGATRSFPITVEGEDLLVLV